VACLRIVGRKMGDTYDRLFVLKGGLYIYILYINILELFYIK